MRNLTPDGVRRAGRTLLIAGLLALLTACGLAGGPGAGDRTPPAAGPGADSGGPVPTTPNARPRPQEGSPAPDWRGMNVLTGRPLAATDLRGRVVLLNFFATWCAPCKTEMPDMERFARLAGDQVAVVAIGADPTESPEELANFARSLGVTFAVVHDDGKAALDYLATGIPTSFFVDAQGIIRARHPGILSLAEMRQMAVKAGANLPATEEPPAARSSAGQSAAPAPGPQP